MNGPVPLYATSLHYNLTLAAHQWPVTREERVTVTPNMFLEAHRQRKISDISTLARVVHKTHKAKLNFVRKCKL